MSENLYKNIQTSNKNLLKLIEYSKKFSTTNVIKQQFKFIFTNKTCYDGIYISNLLTLIDYKTFV